MSRKRPLSAWRRGYVFVVLTAVHSLLVLALLELGARGVFALRDSLAPPAIADAVRAVYPSLEEAEIRRLLDETWRRPWRYEPWTGFREAPRRGRYVNISEQGFRFSVREERDLREGGFDLYVFGGSTTFGYGVDDLSTIPGHLQRLLAGRARVFNFGRGYYYSAQELALFQELLRRGHVPRLALFLDGLNEGQEEPFYTEQTRRLFAAHNRAPWRLAAMGARRGLEGSALYRLFEGVRRRVAGQPQPPPPAPGAAKSPEDVREGYLRSSRLVEAAAERHGVRTFFFIQPVPGHRNAFGDHPLMRYPASAESGVDPRMARLEETADGVSRFNLAGLLEDHPGPAFVDSFHYTPEVCALLARAILERLEPALPGAGGAEETATGKPRDVDVDVDLDVEP